ncbi:MAG: TetR/AcrR family transcriptional regulator [Solirubrobacterales bacterium]|nr:TetR/AcrR family transcriptional regulator [Solirubrobacterales bacterium]
MATRPTRKALGERYDRRRQEVVDGAAREWARRGVEQTSVQQLAEALGIAAGGIYHYFSGKEQLLIAICDDLVNPLLEEARALVAREAAPEERLRELVRLWVAQVVERQDHMLVFQQQRHVIDRGAQWKDVRASRKAFERLVEQVLEECATRPVDPRLALAALLGMVNHTAQWYRPRGHLTSSRIADGYVDLLLAAE